MPVGVDEPRDDDVSGRHRSISAPSADSSGPTAAILSPSTRTSAPASSPSSGSWVRTIRVLDQQCGPSSIVPLSVRLLRDRLWPWQRQVRAGFPPHGRSVIAGPPDADDSATRAKSTSPPMRPGGGKDHVQIRGGLGHLDAGRLGQSPDQPEVLAGQRQRERDRGRVRIDERRALVGHERGAGRARRKDVVRRPRPIPFRSASTRPSAIASLSPKMSVLTASFMAAPVPSGPMWKIRRPGARGPAAPVRGLRHRPPTISVRSPASASSPTLPLTPGRRGSRRRVACDGRREPP